MSGELGHLWRRFARALARQIHDAAEGLARPVRDLSREVGQGARRKEGLDEHIGRVVEASAPGHQQYGFSQQQIYDLRYQQDGYDNRSVVHVLTSEMSALHGAVERATKSNPEAGVISLFDFGYGTGRVTKDFALAHPTLPGDRKDLLVLAYDVSGTGLAKSASMLRDLHGFQGSFSLRKASTSGYVMGDLSRATNGVSVTFRFVHGHENDSFEAVQRLIIDANEGNRVTVTSSWYGSVSHTPGVVARSRLFETLGSLTHPRGEMVISVSATGDLVEDRQFWLEKLRNDDVAGLPIEVRGDTIYETEIPGLNNFYHVFDTDFDDSMMLTLTDQNQHYWVEAIRFPDPEFETVQAEQENYRRVREFNERKAGRLWTPDDYAQLHTVAGFRSGVVNSPPDG